MGLYDEREKLRQAELWLINGDAVHREAAREHVEWMCHIGGVDPKVREEALRLRREYLVMM